MINAILNYNFDYKEDKAYIQKNIDKIPYNYRDETIIKSKENHELN